MRKLLLASSALAIMAMSGQWALMAQDVYHGGSLDARQHGYEHGYREGFTFGENSQVSNRDQDIVNQRLRAADRDYQPSFGSQEQYRQGYTEGFRAGMEDARRGERSRLEDLFKPTDPDYNPDRRRDDRARDDRSSDDRIDGIYPQNHWPAMHVASDIGYRDGLGGGMRDRRDGRGYESRKHGAWRDGLHGYDRQSGSQAQYRRAYREAYELGYRDGYGRRSH